MKPFDYFRQAKYSLGKQNRQGLDPRDELIIQANLLAATHAVKFTLPDGGRIMETDFSHLPSELHLPYPIVLLEYTSLNFPGGLAEQEYGSESVQCPKRICIAIQSPDGFINVSSILYVAGQGWNFSPFTARIVPANGAPATPLFEGKRVDGINLAIAPFHTLDRTGQTQEQLLKAGYIDMVDECGAVLALIEALACTNVQAMAMPKTRPGATLHKCGGLPFDEYRVLTITPGKSGGHTGGSSGYFGGTRREHLRRGHIRRHATAGNVWVNACVVNPGAAGKVHKEYIVRSTTNRDARG